MTLFGFRSSTSNFFFLTLATGGFGIIRNSNPLHLVHGQIPVALNSARTSNSARTTSGDDPTCSLDSVTVIDPLSCTWGGGSDCDNDAIENCNSVECESCRSTTFNDVGAVACVLCDGASFNNVGTVSCNEDACQGATFNKVGVVTCDDKDSCTESTFKDAERVTCNGFQSCDDADFNNVESIECNEKAACKAVKVHGDLTRSITCNDCHGIEVEAKNANILCSDKESCEDLNANSANCVLSSVDYSAASVTQGTLADETFSFNGRLYQNSDNFQSEYWLMKNTYLGDCNANVVYSLCESDPTLEIDFLDIHGVFVESGSSGDGVWDCAQLAAIDTDGDGIPDYLTDADGDGIPDFRDNCPNEPTPILYDGDDLNCALEKDGKDSDLDNIPDYRDNCPNTPNIDQEDSDGDGVGDICDNCIYITNPAQEDTDNDLVGDFCDNCPNTANTGQEDTDGNGIGDACSLQLDINSAVLDATLYTFNATYTAKVDLSGLATGTTTTSPEPTVSIEASLIDQNILSITSDVSGVTATDTVDLSSLVSPDQDTTVSISGVLSESYMLSLWSDVSGETATGYVDLSPLADTTVSIAGALTDESTLTLTSVVSGETATATVDMSPFVPSPPTVSIATSLDDETDTLTVTSTVSDVTSSHTVDLAGLVSKAVEQAVEQAVDRVPSYNILSYDGALKINTNRVGEITSPTSKSFVMLKDAYLDSFGVVLDSLIEAPANDSTDYYIVFGIKIKRISGSAAEDIVSKVIRFDGGDDHPAGLVKFDDNDDTPIPRVYEGDILTFNVFEFELPPRSRIYASPSAHLHVESEAYLGIS